MRARGSLRLHIVFLILIALDVQVHGASGNMAQNLIKDHGPEAMAIMWNNLTQGNNVALHKSAALHPYPAYCADKNDQYQLTDGVILFTSQEGLTSNQMVNKLRRSRAAVGWGNQAAVYITIDLEQVTAIQRVVIRYQGGLPGLFDFPTRITLVVSEDGQHFHRAGEYRNESGTGEGPFACYRMPHLGDQAVIFPFAFDRLHTKGRYVGLELQPRGYTFVDEVAVIAEDSDPAKMVYDDSASYSFPCTPAAIVPRGRRLHIPNNASVFENLIVYNDLSREWKKVRWVVELPSGISLSSKVHGHGPEPIPEKPYKHGLLPSFKEPTKVSRDGQTYTRYVFDYAGPYDQSSIGKATNRLGPLFFEASGPAREAGYAYVYAEWDDGRQEPLALPITVYSLPHSESPKRLHVSLGWMADNYAVAWPDFCNQYRRVGFNVYPTFPRAWGRLGFIGAETKLHAVSYTHLTLPTN